MVFLTLDETSLKLELNINKKGRIKNDQPGQNKRLKKKFQNEIR